MPTGYTYGILNGKVKTFAEFTKICMRAFGACIHMRDEDNDKPYVPDKVEDYHIKALHEAKMELAKARTIPDDILIKKQKSYLKGREKEIVENIKKIEENQQKLKTMIAECTIWEPPTSEHVELKKFMLEQLTSTLEHDGDDSYYRTELIKVRNSLKNINPEKIRAENIESAENNVKYHTKQLKEEEGRVAERNKWATDLLKSLE
jgi:hypothetical protein